MFRLGPDNLVVLSVEEVMSLTLRIMTILSSVTWEMKTGSC